MKYAEILFGAFLILIVLIGIGGILYAISAEPQQVKVKVDYTSRVVVDKSEKVPWAISNAMENVRSRNFVMTGLKTIYVKSTGNFVIECSGTEDAHVLKTGK